MDYAAQRIIIMSIYDYLMAYAQYVTFVNAHAMLNRYISVMRGLD